MVVRGMMVAAQQRSERSLSCWAFTQADKCFSVDDTFVVTWLSWSHARLSCSVRKNWWVPVTHKPPQHVEYLQRMYPRQDWQPGHLERTAIP